MISRKSTVRIQQFYELVFCPDPLGYGPLLDKEKLHYFLYEEEHEGWFVDLFDRHVKYVPDLKRFILNLHTGMAYVSKTQTLNDKKAIGQSMLKRLAISILKEAEGIITANQPEPKEILQIKSHVDALTRQLQLDGYIYKNEGLFPIESSAVDEQEEQGYLENLIDGMSLRDSALIKHHLSLSEDHFLKGTWGDSISNSRNFLESLLEQIANALHIKQTGNPLPQNISSRPVEVRKYLEQEGLIDSVERESLAKNYGLISNTGSHPNMAHQDQARLMRNLALTFSQYILLQWAGYLKNNP
jgi:hypothetical protein